MIGDLIINGKDAYKEYGVSMGEGFLDSLLTPCEMKDFLEINSRLVDGKVMITSNRKVSARELTLAFVVEKTENNMLENFRSLIDLFSSTNLEIQVPPLGEEVYKLVYLGKNITYGMDISRSVCKVSAKFAEPNPKDRNAQ